MKLHENKELFQKTFLPKTNNIQLIFKKNISLIKLHFITFDKRRSYLLNNCNLNEL